MLRGAFSRWALLAASCLVTAVFPLATRADNCKLLRYTFQPDCFRGADGGACVQRADKLDLGPQIAVWIETSDHRFIDTLMVTNAVAARGLGNRPGEWNFLSGPKFPYGKRQMALPIWAHARNRLYPQVVMQDGMEDWLGWHEPVSSEDLYYCRPVRAPEINVDAITCPTKFNSAKGRVDSSLPMVYYPPRNDLTSFTDKDCDKVFSALPCQRSAEMYSTMNDLDAVAAATPAYGRAYTGTWAIPAGQGAGDYALMVEVNKEFDTNASHLHMAFEDPRLVGYGINNNFGQPAVVWRLPVRFESPKVTSADAIYGYGAWDGTNGDIQPRDQSISTGVPGSGEGRLQAIAAPGGATGRVLVSVEQCDGVTPVPDAGNDPDAIGAGGSGGFVDGDNGCGDGADLPPVSGLTVDATSLAATTARVVFTGPTDVLLPSNYDVRYRVGQSLTEDDFLHQAVSAPQVTFDPLGNSASVVLPDLKPATTYAVGVKYQGACARQSQLAWTTFATSGAKFKQLSGCFIATAAYGSALDPAVDAMRRVRDDLAKRNGLFAAAADIYYRSGPAAADVLAKSETARALVRRLLGPAAALAAIVSGR